jgi:hypothetical protein
MAALSFTAGTELAIGAGISVDEAAELKLVENVEGIGSNSDVEIGVSEVRRLVEDERALEVEIGTKKKLELVITDDVDTKDVELSTDEVARPELVRGVEVDSEDVDGVTIINAPWLVVVVTTMVLRCVAVLVKAVVELVDSGTAFTADTSCPTTIVVTPPCAALFVDLVSFLTSE